VSYATVVAGASRRGETAVGYRSAAMSGDPDAAYGVRVNLPKSATIVVEPGDRVVVLAEA
jgi:urease beta subunit